MSQSLIETFRARSMIAGSFGCYTAISAHDHETVRSEGCFFGSWRWDKSTRDKRVREVAKTLDLEEYLNRKPRALSGGQQQRVAMERAIVRQPQAYLMDEPLSNLDAKLRVSMRAELAKLQRDLNVTTLYVTHDQTEAMTMGDRIAVIRKSELQQAGPPTELFSRARQGRNEFIARIDPKTQVRADDTITLTIDTAQMYFFDPATGEVIHEGRQSGCHRAG